MSAHRPRHFVRAVVCLAALAAGCAAPPTKELSQAEGALEAARAAGAPTYAAADFTAAEQTLARAHAEVAERDYRAALGHALDSSARAQAAATAAIDGRVKARLAADQTLDDLAVLIETVEAALATPEAKRVPAGPRQKARAVVDGALKALAAARAAVEKDDLSVLAGVPAQVTALDAALASLTPPPPRKPRARS